MAVAAILGHNFPIYLKFQGGKGVATSLGSVFALDAVASVCSATGFVVFLLITRYVSMSSILGGLVWLIAHFARVEHPMARDQIAMTVASLGLMGLLIVRHRKNLVRIGAGTEPKVNLRKKKKRPEGRIASRPAWPSLAVRWDRVGIRPERPTDVRGRRRTLSRGRGRPGRDRPPAGRAARLRRSRQAPRRHLPEVRPGDALPGDRG